MSDNRKVPKENTSLSTEDIQEANASGDNNNEQGQASFVTGSTTAGGSNYGQGSSHLSGESYVQGNKANSGSNYDNERNKLGASSTGTNNEGSSSPLTGADQLNPGSNGKEHSIDERLNQDNVNAVSPGQDIDKGTVDNS